MSEPHGTPGTVGSAAGALLAPWPAGNGAKFGASHGVPRWLVAISGRSTPMKPGTHQQYHRVSHSLHRVRMPMGNTHRTRFCRAIVPRAVLPHRPTRAPCVPRPCAKPAAKVERGKTSPTFPSTVAQPTRNSSETSQTRYRHFRAPAPHASHVLPAAPHSAESGKRSRPRLTPTGNPKEAPPTTAPMPSLARP